MREIHFSAGEFKLMNLIWREEPVNSTYLVKLSREAFGWKKSTTYTVLKKLEEKNAVQNISATVISLVGREKVLKQESEEFLQKNFNGSLADFLKIILQDKTLSAQEAEILQKIVETAAKSYGE